MIGVDVGERRRRVALSVSRRRSTTEPPGGHGGEAVVERGLGADVGGVDGRRSPSTIVAVEGVLDVAACGSCCRARRRARQFVSLSVNSGSPPAGP